MLLGLGGLPALFLLLPEVTVAAAGTLMGHRCVDAVDRGRRRNPDGSWLRQTSLAMIGQMTVEGRRRRLMSSLRRAGAESVLRCVFRWVSNQAQIDPAAAARGAPEVTRLARAAGAQLAVSDVRPGAGRRSPNSDSAGRTRCRLLRCVLGGVACWRIRTVEDQRVGRVIR